MKKFLVILAVVIAIAVGAYYFFSAKGDVCKNVIPEDAKAVMTFSGTELVKQLDFSISDIFELLKLKGDDDKEDVGVDLLSPMYGFISSDNYVCCVLPLSDAEALEEVITDKNITVESGRGFKWAYLENVLVCFDSKKALLMGLVSKAESDGMRTRVVEWMKQGSHEIPMLSSIRDKKGVLRLRTNLEALPDKYKSLYKGLFLNLDLNKVFLNLTFNLKENAFVLSAETETDVEEFYKKVSNYFGYNRPIQGNQLQNPQSESVGCLMFNLDGEGLYKKLSEGPTSEMLFSGLKLYCSDADLILKAIGGDVLVELGKNDDNPWFLFNAHVKNKDFMKNAQTWGSGLPASSFLCQKIDKDNFMIQNAEDKYYFGVRDDVLYATSDTKMLNSSKDDSSFGSRAAGKLFYLSICVNSLKKISDVKSSLEAKDESANELFNSLDHLNVSVSENGIFELELTTKEKISDLIKMNLKK